VKIIDAHIHILDRDLIPSGVRLAWARQALGRREPMRNIEEVEPNVMVKQSDPYGSLTIAAFDRVGIDGGLIPVVDWTLAAGRSSTDVTIDELHDFHDGLFESSNGRIRYCAGIDPRHHDARSRLTEVVGRKGCSGIKIYPAAGWRLTDQSHWWVFDFARDNNVPIVIHTSSLGGDPLITPYSRPSEIAPVMAAYPTVSWVFAHAGFEAWWLEAVDIASGWQSVYLDLSLWQKSADADYSEFRRRVKVALSRVGSHRIIFGSDIIRGPGEDPEGKQLEKWVEQFKGLADSYKGEVPVVSENGLELMMAGNASRLYGF
jgi:predicted TIM-barrel fold metal-dependent hydrolase